MPRIQPRVLKGFRDFLPREQAGRQAVVDTLSRVFRTFGFQPLSTPAIEYKDVLTGKYGDEGDKLLYHFKDHGGREVALRYDLTVPLARVVASHRELPTPFKRYQVGTVWRAEKPARGRFREFVQCDADIVGTASPLADADCIAAGVAALRELGVEGFTVRLGHRKVLDRLLDASGVEPAGRVEVLRALDKLDKAGEEQVRAMISDIAGPGASKALVDTVCSMVGRPADVLPSLASLDGARHVEEVVLALDSMGLAGFVEIDMRIARGLDYYTGTVFETTLARLPDMGSIMSGGRYDNLLDVFGMPGVPAVGVSIGVDRLLSALDELGVRPGDGAEPRAVVCPLGRGNLEYSLDVLSRLRNAGIPSELVHDPDARLKKQLQYASRRGSRFALIVGDQETERECITVKDLAHGTQQEVQRSEIADFLARGGSDGDARHQGA